MTPLALNSAQMDEAATLYALHAWPTSDIAEHFGVSERAVRTALHRRGVQMRPRHAPQPTLRVKQCACCLHFLPLALFSGRDATRARLASWCNDCTNQPRRTEWHMNVPPLAKAIAHWRAQ